MAFWLKSLARIGIVGMLGVVALTGFGSPVSAQLPDISIKAIDTTLIPGQQNIPVSVFMDNIVDTIAGFNVTIQLSRYDLIYFQTSLDTVYDTLCYDWVGQPGGDSVRVPCFYWLCVDADTLQGSQGDSIVCHDSVGVDDDFDFIVENDTIVTIGTIDTSGTLSSGWDYVRSLVLTPAGDQVEIVGIADLDGIGTKGVPKPQQGGTLIKLLADVYPECVVPPPPQGSNCGITGDSIADTLTDRTVGLTIQTDFKDQFGLSRTNGTSIPWVPVLLPDSACWVCDQWLFGDCVDSTAHSFSLGCEWVTYDTIERLVLDTANILVESGSITVLASFVCGNVDGDLGGFVDVADVVYFVEYSFSNPPGPPPPNLDAADVNCDSFVDVADIVYMVEYSFGNPAGPEPCAACN